jgi:hypothetical protein
VTKLTAIGAQAEVKQAFWALFDTPDDIKPGPAAEVSAQQRIDAFATTYAKAYPAAVRWLLDDRHALTAYLRFPPEHWHRIRQPAPRRHFTAPGTPPAATGFSSEPLVAAQRSGAAQMT